MESGAGKDTGGVITQPKEVICSRCADSNVIFHMSIRSLGLGLILERDFVQSYNSTVSAQDRDIASQTDQSMTY